MSQVELERLANNVNIHPLLALQAQADIDRRSPLDAAEFDHGTWDGRWEFLCEREWNQQVELGKQLFSPRILCRASCSQRILLEPDER